MWWYHSKTVIWWLLHKTPRFLRSENGKWIFRASRRKTFSCNIVRHTMIHMCAQYGQIITNYDLILAITLVVWSESHETSDMIGNFWEGFFETLAIYQGLYFSMKLCHIRRHHAKDLHWSDRFWIFYASFKLWSKRRTWRFLSRGWASLNLHWISEETWYFESKTHFFKK